MKSLLAPKLSSEHVCTCGCKPCHDTGVIVSDTCRCGGISLEQHIRSCVSPCVMPGCKAGREFAESLEIVLRPEAATL